MAESRTGPGNRLWKLEVSHLGQKVKNLTKADRGLKGRDVQWGGREDLREGVPNKEK